MPYNPLFDLSNQLIKDSFFSIVQVGPSGEYYNGLGQEIFLGGSSSVGPTGPTGLRGATGAVGPTGPSTTTYYAQTTPPGSPSLGDRWYNTNTGIEYVWINDGDSSQWVVPARGNSENFIVTERLITIDVNDSTPLVISDFTYTYYGINTTDTLEITLPIASGNNGRKIVFKDQSGNRSNAVTITGASPSNIDGSGSYTLNNSYQSVTLVANQNNWYSI